MPTTKQAFVDSSNPADPDLALGMVLSELHELHDNLRARPIQQAVGELESQLERARRELSIRLADDDGPRSGDLRVLQRLDLAFRRVADLLAEGRLRAEERRILEHAADLLRSVQGYTRAHFLNGRA
jgi:hypothetical protein